MITFKVLKYKHIREAQRLQDDINRGEASDDALLRYAISLIEEWDFKDVESGKSLALDEYDELSIEQLNEVFEEFNKAFSRETNVPK